jgi:hypothetical protein
MCSQAHEPGRPTAAGGGDGGGCAGMRAPLHALAAQPNSFPRPASQASHDQLQVEQQKVFCAHAHDVRQSRPGQRPDAPTGAKFHDMARMS